MKKDVAGEGSLGSFHPDLTAHLEESLLQLLQLASHFNREVVSHLIIEVPLDVITLFQPEVPRQMEELLRVNRSIQSLQVERPFARDVADG